MLKGLKLTPTPENKNIQELQTDLSEFHRKIRLKECFSNNTTPNDDSLVRNKSNFQPPKGRNAALEQFIEINNTAILNQPENKAKHNISSNECKAILSLQNDDSIVIREADKGGGIVIMNSEFYKNKIKEMLNDKAFYKPTDENHSKSTFKKIRDIIKSSKDLTRYEIDYLLNFECKSSNLYGLPKIHKCKTITERCTNHQSEYIRIIDTPDLTFRPIVAGPTCETHRLSNLIEVMR